MSDIFTVIGHAILTTVLPGIGTAIGLMLVVVVKNFLASQGLDLTEKQETRLKQIIVDKIHATEEVAHRSLVDGTQLTSVDKKAKTVNDAVVAATDDPTIPNPSVQKVAALVDAELGKARAGYPNPGLPGLGRI